MAATLLNDLPRATDANGNPLSGAKWKFYDTGTTTPRAVFAEDTLATSLGSTVTADAGGKFVPIYLNAAYEYRAILEDADGAEYRDIDPVNVIDPLVTLAAAGGATLVNGLILPVASKAAMAAVAISGHTHVWYGGEVWKWSAANLATEVAADTAAALYNPPASDVTGASGAWVRQFRGLASIEFLDTISAANVENMSLLGKGIECEPNKTYEFEDVIYLQGDNLVVRGNGATWKNVAPGPHNLSETTQRVIGLGTSHPASNALLTYHPITSIDGREITLTSGGSNFAAGHKIVMKGASGFTAGSLWQPRWLWRTRVMSVSGNVLIVEDAPPPELVADTPEVATPDGEPVTMAFDGNRDYYLMYRPLFDNLNLYAEQYNLALYRGGIIHGEWRGGNIDGHSGLSINALQFCNWHDFSFQARGIAIELSDGCYGTHVHHFTGTFHNGDDPYNFVMAIGENGHHNTISDFTFIADLIDPTGNAIMLAPGTHNTIRDGYFDLSAMTGATTMAFVTAYAGDADVEDCLLENIEGECGAPQYMLQFAPGGGSTVRRCIARGLKLRGAPTIAAVKVNGEDNELHDCWFEAGTLVIDPASTGAKITGNYIADGILNPVASMFEDNTVYGNTSDRSERLRGQAVFDDSGSNVTTTVANTTLKTVTFAAGDLKGLDSVRFYIPGQIWGGAGTVRNLRVKVRCDGASDVELIHWTEDTHRTPFEMRGELFLNTTTSIDYNVSVISQGNTVTAAEGVISGGAVNTTTNPVILTIEAWTGNATEYLIIRTIRIAARVPGMKNAEIDGW